MTPRSSIFLTLGIAVALSIQAQARQAPPDLSDPEVAHVAVTANSIDIELARVAESRAAKATVKAFARTMITDHSAVNAQAGELAKRLNVTPRDNPVSQSLQAGALAARASLEKLNGAAFDRGYMDREIAYHQAVLEAIDGLLVPTTENADLKKLLTDVRPAIAAHLAHARELRSSLGASE